MDGWADDDIRDIRETLAGTNGTPQRTPSGNQRRVVREDVGSPSRGGHRIGDTSSVGDQSRGTSQRQRGQVNVKFDVETLVCFCEYSVCIHDLCI